MRIIDLRSSVCLLQELQYFTIAGTWARNSRIVRGKAPFARDDQVLEYEVDSEEEWEEEEEGIVYEKSTFLIQFKAMNV